MISMVSDERHGEPAQRAEPEVIGESGHPVAPEHLPGVIIGVVVRPFSGSRISCRTFLN